MKPLAIQIRFFRIGGKGERQDQEAPLSGGPALCSVANTFSSLLAALSQRMLDHGHGDMGRQKAV